MPGKVPKFSEVKQLKFRAISKKEMDSMSKRFAENLRKEEEERKKKEVERWKPKKEQIGFCLCRGPIVLLTSYTSEFNPTSGPIIIGPGSRDQFRRVEHQKCFCAGCGLHYEAEVVKKKQG